MFDESIGGLKLSRRDLIAGSAAASVLGLLGGSRALAKAPMINAAAPAVYRFKIGAFEATVVSDGPLAIGEAKPELFQGLSKETIDRTLSDNFLSRSNVTLEQNALVVNTGDKLVLFDAGVGVSPAFGPSTGRLIANLKAAGIEPEAIDAVVITHAHPDHCWGLGAGAAFRFPNAQVYLSQGDFEFWTDEAKRSMPFIGGFIDPTRAVLLPLRERMIFVKDGQEILPGIQAMATPGHTVGHTSYVVSSQGQSILNTADLAHHFVLVMENPKVKFGFDTDPAQGADTRIRVFDMVAAGKMPIIAYHFPWPGIGHVVKHGDGYRYIATPMLTAL
ncbi:MBL fold metallo-hydrolase [Pseudolabrys sp. FHR47]|uniref:MBL fold metallo-hydrolase n=1 Tax=Pseudolabrys sp. FHR47 TaxID=2562284 RepID=UPI0010BF2973|nr:MBL fold metallo-hydrolase [Pseudolabrys sp. FHR47]